MADEEVAKTEDAAQKSDGNEGYPCAITKREARQFSIGPDNFGLVFNPVVFVLGSGLLWGLAIYCMIDTCDKNIADDCEPGREYAIDLLKGWQAWVGNKFTWLYIGSQDIWILFIIAVYWKFGDVKLGKGDDKPDFSDTTYFMMLFSCGVAVGLFFYGVSEPLWHLQSNRFVAGGVTSDNEDAQIAMRLTIYHWGFHGWIVYSLVAILMGYMAFAKGLRLTIRSCFYPLLGDRIYGWAGDVIDAFSIFTVVAGVCTSLGLGATQIVTGLQRLEVLDLTCKDDAICTSGSAIFDQVACDLCLTENEMTTAKVIVIWVMTAIATTSVISGLAYGIKAISQLAFCLALVIMSMVFFMDDTFYFLNVIVQTTGDYFQNVIGLGFETDAFGEMKVVDGGNAHGNPVMQADDPATLDVDESGVIPCVWGPSDGNKASCFWLGWMNGWTIFYWGWWIAWSPFVGMFVAKISKNRSIKEVIHYSLSGPLLFAIIWFSIFGGAGINHHRRGQFIAANANGFQYLDGPTATDFSTLVWDAADPAHMDKTGTSTCYEVPRVNCADQVAWHGKLNATAIGKLSSLVTSCSASGFAFGNPDVSPVCVSGPGDHSWFEVIEAYYGYGKFLSWLSMITLVLYFVTSSDSGSLVTDAIASNGAGFADDDKVSIPQRIFWALTEGGVATALMVAGGADALKALQAASICAGLPYTIVLCLMCTSLWRVLSQDAAEPGCDVHKKAAASKKFGVDFVGGVFDVFEILFSFGGSEKKPSSKDCIDFGLAIVCPPLGVMAILSKHNAADPENLGSGTFFGSQAAYNIVITAGSAVTFYAAVILHFLEVAEDVPDSVTGLGADSYEPGYWALAWTCYVMFACVLTNVRSIARAKLEVEGNVFEDFFASLFVYPQVIAQAQASNEVEAAADVPAKEVQAGFIAGTSA